MQGGWGGMGGGAWGTKPLVDPEESEAPSAPSAAAAPSKGSKANPVYAAQAPPPQPTGAFSNAFMPSATPAPGGAYAGSFAAADAAGSASFADRERALKQKEKELAEKEKQLKTLESELKASGAVIKKKNWPICFPFMHHDIATDIPDKSKRVVREVYLCWWGLILCLSFQLFCASVMLGYKSAEDRVASWFLAVIYWVLGVPLSFWLWYKRIYNAARDDGTMGYVAFFLFFTLHLAFCIWAAIAVPINNERWSFTGFVAAMQAFDVGAFPGVIYIIGSCLWCVEALWCFWCLKDAYFFFRGAGGVKEVKQQAALAAFQASMNNNSNRV